MVRKHVADLAASDLSLDIAYIHRVDRTGYKAGALEAGQKVAKGELIAVFDATSWPQPEFLEQVRARVHRSEGPMVQARWGHLNRGHSLLNRVKR